MQNFPCNFQISLLSQIYFFSLLHLLLNALLNILCVTHMFNAVNSADSLTFVQNITAISSYSLRLK